MPPLPCASITARLTSFLRVQALRAAFFEGAAASRFGADTPKPGSTLPGRFLDGGTRGSGARFLRGLFRSVSPVPARALRDFRLPLGAVLLRPAAVALTAPRIFALVVLTPGEALDLSGAVPERVRFFLGIDF